MEVEGITALSCGATFFRADLHIHSYGASHDVKDDAATPEHIVAAAVRESVSIIGVADHNEIESVAATIAEGEKQGVFVVPAVELSTPEGHLLCYAPTMDALERFFNRISIAGRRTNESRCNTGMFDLLFERVRENDLRIQLEAVAIHDTPRLTVTKRVLKDGKETYVPREFKRLSLGQQQSVLLALMLTSESRAPLIVDQPEDNLDSEFIYKTLVPVIRRVKERRQVIVVTHNANIAVLGDAEQIVVLKATHDRGVITCRGSVDEPETREQACAILEGSREAFERRARIYGVRR